MKTLLPFFLLLLTITASAQITTPIIKAGFGVDGELKANFYNGSLSNGNDDWFLDNTGVGRNVIDTTGAAAIVAGYLTDVSPWKKRMSSFYRPMSVPQFSIVNNKLWLDALFVRDYHATDTTVFVSGSNKNGDSPASWMGGIQGVPDKNDILDMFMHVRRAGPNRTDSLWMFGGLSLDNTTGQRYFDFEMYQTDIYYDRPTGKWFGFGPDAGHTSWQFDAAGNVTRPGDIIFSAEYQSSTLTKIEARIWINKAYLSTTPAGFNWSGQFDGAGTGAQYGYASILPKTSGAFYTGLGSGNNTWTGPFQLVLVDNSLATNYSRDQFMEFSVNLTKLGLDPVTTFGSDICGTPFNRIVVKTRSSASFTSELKDFVAPTDLFLAPRAQAVADVPFYCGPVGVSNLSVINPSASSIYTWSTTDGHIIDVPTGPYVTVDSPGTYIVKQQLAAGCNPYAYDTLTILHDASCIPMANRITGLRGSIKYNTAHLNWTTKANKETVYFEVERSINGRDFMKVGTVMADSPNGEADYSFDDNIATIGVASVYYRLRAVMHVGQANYSGIIMLSTRQDQKAINLFPNPVNDVLQLSVPSATRQEAKVSIFDISGSLLRTESFMLNNGVNILQMDATTWKAGTYMLQIKTGETAAWKKFVVNSTLFNK